MDQPSTQGNGVGRRSGLLFLAGLVLGLIPAMLMFLSVSWQPFCYRSCDPVAGQASAFIGGIGIRLYLLEILSMVVLLAAKRTRPIGYALLMMIFVTPVIAVTGCTVRLPAPRG